MAELSELLRVMAKLRSPEGCPWDREQTHQSLRPYLLEETYEVLEAIEQDNPAKLCDELGDLLLQIVFHAQLAQEQGQFDMGDVIAAITNKMITRHPHVFGEVNVDGVQAVLRNWERIKAREKGMEERQSLLDGIPQRLPALMQAAKVQSKAARVGFDWPAVDGALAKVHEELAELAESMRTGDRTAMTAEVGDLLFAVVNVARFLQVDAELALGQTVAKFKRRFRYIEEQAAKAGKDLQQMTLAEMDELWEKAKEKER